MKQLTKQQAAAFHRQGTWIIMTTKEKVEFQIHQKFLCMPFGVYHKAVEELALRPVWPHELNPGLGLEMLKEELGIYKETTSV